MYHRCIRFLAFLPFITSYRLEFPSHRLRAEHRARPEAVEVKCSDYSFNLTRYATSPVIVALRQPRNGSIEANETTTAASAAVTGDEPHFEDKVSYNQLFWPFTQAFKAPIVVRCENDPELPGCKELLAPTPLLTIQGCRYEDRYEEWYESAGCSELDTKPGFAPAPGWSPQDGYASPHFDSWLSNENGQSELDSRKARQAYEDLLKDLEAAEDLLDLETASSPELGSEQSSLQNKTAALVAELDTLDHNLVSQLPGCYPLVMPFASAVTAAKWKLAGSEDPLKDSSSHELASDVSFEAQADFSLFISIVEAVEGINAGMQSSHNYSQCGKTQMLAMMGSYLGVSLRKDVGIAQCEVKESLPSCWQDFMTYLANNTATGQEFPYENLTVDSLFFDYEDYSLTVGDYNLTLENFDLEYNITETAYAKIESLTGMTNSLAEYKDNVVEKLRSEYDEVLKARTVPEQVSSGFSFDLYSPDMETVNMLRRKRMIGTSMEREATTLAPTSSPDQLWDECKLVNTSNIQHCWEKMIMASFEQMDSEHINSYLAMANLALISYSTTIMVALAQAVQMLSLASFFVATPLIHQLYGDSEDRHPVNRLTCIYDIIMEKELEFDASFEVEEGGKSILKTLVRPFSRDNFATYPFRLLNTTTLILIHREELVQGLTNITAAVVEKLSAIIEEGDLAHKIAAQSDEMRDWLLGIDVIKVLESFVELTKAALHSSHRLRSGNWPELVAVLEEMVQLAQTEGFWMSLGEMVEGVVGKRWQSLDFIMSWAVEPAIRNLVEGLEWLAEDVAEHLREAAEMIRECDDSWLVDHYGSGWGSVARGTLCGDDKQPEVVFHKFFKSAIETISMVEPSFALLSPDGTCALFNSCNLEVESELRKRVDRSGLSNAFNAIFRPLLTMKRAMICHAAPNLEKKLWQYVLI